MAGIILTLWLQTLEICNFPKRLRLLLKTSHPDTQIGFCVNSTLQFGLKCDGDQGANQFRTPAVGPSTTSNELFAGTGAAAVKAV